MSSSAESLNPAASRVVDADVDRIVKLLDAFTEASPVTAATIGRTLGLGDTPGSPYVRACITMAIRRRLAPVGANSRGYFRLHSPDEIWRYAQSLRRREMGIRLRRIAVVRALEDGPVPPGEPLQWVPDEDPEER